MRRQPSTTHSQTEFRPRDDKLYIAFNKPYEVLSQFTRPEESDKRTLAEFNFPANVYPIGRLDYDSEGLLLLSDDGAFNDALLNPARQHARSYLAQIENIPSTEALKQLEQGIIIQRKQTLRARARLLEKEPEIFPRPVPIRYRKEISTSWIELTLSEGRNRQVRRMTAAVGCPTLRLIRIAIGRLDLHGLKIEPGEWQMLSHEQVRLALQH